MSRPLRAAALLAAAALLVAACGGGKGSGSTAQGGGGATAPVSVKAGEATCEVSVTTLPPGRHTFAVENTAKRVTEVYVYGPGDQVMGELEDLGPATRREFVVDLPAGSYQVACKPGMTGSGIRTALTVQG